MMGLGFGMIFAPAINTATAGVQRGDRGWSSRWSTRCSRSADRSDVRAQHHRADHDDQLPRRSPQRAARAGDRAAVATRWPLRYPRESGVGVISPSPCCHPPNGSPNSGPPPKPSPPPSAPTPAAQAPPPTSRRAISRRGFYRVHAIPVALPCCSPVINHASLPPGRPVGLIAAWPGLGFPPAELAELAANGVRASFLHSGVRRRRCWQRSPLSRCPPEGRRGYGSGPARAARCHNHPVGLFSGARRRCRPGRRRGPEANPVPVTRTGNGVKRPVGDEAEQVARRCLTMVFPFKARRMKAMTWLPVGSVHSGFDYPV